MTTLAWSVSICRWWNMLAKPMQVTSINTTANAAPEPGPTSLMTKSEAATQASRLRRGEQGRAPSFSGICNTLAQPG